MMLRQLGAELGEEQPDASMTQATWNGVGDLPTRRELSKRAQETSALMKAKSQVLKSAGARGLKQLDRWLK